MLEQTGVPRVAAGEAVGPLMKTPTNVSLFMYSATVWLVHRIHYDFKFATSHEALPDLVVHGTLATDWYAQMLHAWAGPGSRVARLSYQIRSYMIPDQTLTCGGTVTSTQESDEGLTADVEVWIRRPDGVEAVTGTATMVIPRGSAREAAT